MHQTRLDNPLLTLLKRITKLGVAMITVTFRERILSQVSDQLNDEGLNFSRDNDIVTEFVAKLYNFTEERAVFLPEIVITNDFDTLKKVFTDTFHVPIGKVKANEDATRKILKACGPLSIAGWSIFVEVRPNTLKYGLFRQSWMPFSLSIEDALRSGGDFPANFIYIRRSFGDAVMITGPKSDTRKIIFSTERPTDTDQECHLNTLCSAVTDKMSNEQAKAEQFMRRTFKQIFLKSHGCIIIVKENAEKTVPDILSDSVLLDPNLDIGHAVSNYASHQDQTTLSNLQAVPSLLKGMIESDGVICFSPDCSVLAYRGFIRKRSRQTDRAGATGGARRRAFTALCDDLGSSLSTVFMQSSDGNMQIRTT